MEHTLYSLDPTRISVEKAIDLVRQVRNDLIKSFLQDENIKLYFSEHYNKDLSQRKLEFLKRDLRELLIAPVDLSHYGILIKQMHDSNTTTLPATKQDLFYKELESIFAKYNY